MFSKISRYRNVPEVTSLDSKGRLLVAKGVRPLPNVTGAFRHTVNGGDRLDQLAYKYYGQPLFWWNICDANPEFLSPLAPLDREPVVTARFPVTASSEPRWSEVFNRLLAMLGVERVQLVEDITLVPQQTATGGESMLIFSEQFSHTVLVTYNRLQLTSAALADTIVAAGLQVGEFAELGQIGQEIVIPPKPTI
jgi:hypothetical protein